MSLTTNAQERKDTPIFSGVLKYFPLALAEVARTSKAGNDQHNPGLPLQWTRSKSGDELDALTRHLLEAGTVDTDGIRHSAKVAWRALANLEKELEAAEKAEADKAEYKKMSDALTLDTIRIAAAELQSRYNTESPLYPKFYPGLGYPAGGTFGLGMNPFKINGC